MKYSHTYYLRLRALLHPVEHNPPIELLILGSILKVLSDAVDKPYFDNARYFLNVLYVNRMRQCTI